MSVTQSVHVAASPEKAFAYVEDLARHVEWQADLRAVEILTEGHTSEGTRAVETRRVAGRTMTNEYEITEHRPPERIAFKTVNGAIRPDGVVTFEPEGDGTRVSFELTLRGVGLARLLVPLISLDARRGVRRDLEALAAALAAA